MSLKTFKPLENYRLNNGNLEIQLDPLTNKLLIENKIKGTKYFINTVTGEHNLTMDYKIIYDRVDNLKEYVIAADKTLQDQINDIIDEIGTIDGTLPEHNEMIKKLQADLLKAFADIDAGTQDLNDYKTETNNTLNDIQNDVEHRFTTINQQITSDKAALDSDINSLETRLENTEQNIIDAEQRLTEDISASEQKISNIQTVNTNLQQQITDNAEALSDYKSSTDSTISGIQTKNENLQQQITDNQTSFTNYKASTD